MRSRVSTDMILLQCSSYCWYSYSSRFAYVLTLKLWWYSRACSPGTISTYYLKWNIRYFTNSHNSRSTVLSSLLLLRVCTLLILPHFLSELKFSVSVHSKVPPLPLTTRAPHIAHAYSTNSGSSICKQRTYNDSTLLRLNSTRRTTYCTRNKVLLINYLSEDRSKNKPSEVVVLFFFLGH